MKKLVSVKICEFLTFRSVYLHKLYFQVVSLGSRFIEYWKRILTVFQVGLQIQANHEFAFNLEDINHAGTPSLLKFLYTNLEKFQSFGLYYKHITIVNDNYRLVSKAKAKAKARANKTFIVQALLMIIKVFLQHRPLATATDKKCVDCGQAVY